MSPAERTAQQTDPLGTLSAWMLPPAAGIVAFGYAVVSTVRHTDQISSAPLAILGLVFALAAAAVLAVSSAPRRAPFSRRWMLIVLLLVACGAVSFTLSTWGLNRLVQDDWGQVSAGILLVGMAQLRPPREIFVAGLVVGVGLGALAAAQSAFLHVAVPSVIYGLVAATPPIALGCGAAAFARLMLRATDRWQRRARAGMARLEPEIRESVTRAVQQEYVTELNRSAAPLLERIAGTGEITQRDIDEAVSAAVDLRGRAIGSLRSGWVDEMVERAGIRAETAVTIEADRDTLHAVTLDQRAVFAAAANTLVQAPQCTVEALTITASAAPDGRAMNTIELVAAVTTRESTRSMRALLMPYLSVLRVVGTDAHLDVDRERVTLGFAYDRD